MKELKSLYHGLYGSDPLNITLLAGAGSSRMYYKIQGQESVIGTIGKELPENEAFVYLSRHFSEKGLPVPRVLAVGEDNKCYLQEYLGDVTLYDIIAAEGLETQRVQNLLKKTLRILARFHVVGSQGIDWSKCYPREAMDRRSIMWDLNYFKYCFVKLTGVEFDEDSLQNEFELLADRVIKLKGETVMLRDFQSRNVMLSGEDPYVIDFQGARRGPGLYDVASFLWQARIGIPDAMKYELAAYYVEQARSGGLDYGKDWLDSLQNVAFLRMLQVLGAYGFRGIYEHKAKFVTSIAQAIENAIALLGDSAYTAYPEIRKILESAKKLERFAPVRKEGRLLVKVYSFSYKKGIPEDLSGNGGGFVFDCRAVHNPGRYDRYKPLTGRDSEVIEFLENDGEILDFLDNCYSLVDHAVERYIKRGFTSLSVSFGCTGGRHRSVYSAEHMAHHIVDRFDCDVQLIHRERGITENLKH